MKFFLGTFYLKKSFLIIQGPLGCSLPCLCVKTALYCTNNETLEYVVGDILIKQFSTHPLWQSEPITYNYSK